MATRPSYKIFLNEDWELKDLYEYPHAFEQCYNFVYCFDSEIELRDRLRIDNAIRAYPWRGGYSFVNMYTTLRSQVSPKDRPQILSMQKASPGWLELLLNGNVATKLAAAVTTLSGAGVAAVGAYKKCYTMMLTLNAERKKRNVEHLQKSAAEVKAINALCVELAKALGYKSLAEMHQKTGDPEISMKLLMGHYRRMEVLVEYSKKGKATLAQGLTLPNLAAPPTLERLKPPPKLLPPLENDE